MSPMEKLKHEDVAKITKLLHREVKNYVPFKGDKKGKRKDSGAPKRILFIFFLFSTEYAQRSKGNTQTEPLEILQKNEVKIRLSSQPRMYKHLNREQLNYRRNTKKVHGIPYQEQK